ncbi:hypothetical protein HOU17_gp018 [Salmonella phage Sw2]|uniref:Uncharacterized protein n=1 Tax=Salmonella phage Sw2 TaxID=2316014 RepID=A0A385INR5_9CAUD|nr:hypothetical protein HOU17_gp018 [Salmonella phage Sw2]AXY84949.1 hypothetical protein CPT_Sw2_018 [Salmonella phage Sw2]
MSRNNRPPHNRPVLNRLLLEFLGTVETAL